MNSKIPVTILSGFLGAGKTTLVQSLLRQAGDKKIALIINEFGAKGVDADLIKGCAHDNCEADALVELANGCICCTVADDFIPTMEMLLARDPRPDHIIIETSGLALPQPLIKAFEWPDIKADVMIDGVVTLVDVDAMSRGLFAPDEAAIDAQRLADESLDHETPLSELFNDQLHSADLVLLTKSDLVSPEELAAQKLKISQSVGEGVAIVTSILGDIDAQLIMGMEADQTDKHSHHHHHHHHDHDDDHHHHEHDHDHDHDGFISFSVALEPIDDRARFEAQLNALLADKDILRVKGFAQMRDGGARLVLQAVGSRLSSHFEMVPVDGADEDGQIVVIGLKNLDQQRVIDGLRATEKAA